LSQKILLVEDHDSLSDLFVVIGEHLGYQTIHASNGLEGIRKAINERPDLIIMDLMMPVMDGIEAIRRIKARRLSCDPPIVVLTASMKEGLFADAIAAGAAEVIYKPVNVETLRKAVRRYLQPRPAAALAS